MNFRSRSPFQPPTTPGYSRARNSRMSIQSQQKKQIKTQVLTPSIKTQVLTTQAGTFDEKFCFQAKVPSLEDDQVYWQYMIGNQVIGQYLRYLIFKQQQFYIRNVPQDVVVDSISLHFDEIPGYLDKNGVVTNKVCSLKLASMVVQKDQAGLRYYDLLYKQTQDVAWKIPMSLGQLKLRILSGNQFLKGQLLTPLMCLFDIKHVGK